MSNFKLSNLPVKQLLLVRLLLATIMILTLFAWISPAAGTKGLIVRVYPAYIVAGEEPNLQVAVFDSKGRPVSGAQIYLHGHPMAKTVNSGLTPKSADWGHFGHPGLRKITAKKGSKKGDTYLVIVEELPKNNGLVSRPIPKINESDVSPRVAAFTSSGDPASGVRVIHPRVGPICTTRGSGMTVPGDCGQFSVGKRGGISQFRVERGKSSGKVVFAFPPKGEDIHREATLSVVAAPKKVKTKEGLFKVSVYTMDGTPVRDAKVFIDNTKLAETKEEGTSPELSVDSPGTHALVVKKGDDIGITLLGVVRGQKNGETGQTKRKEETGKTSQQEEHPNRSSISGEPIKEVENYINSQFMNLPSLEEGLSPEEKAALGKIRKLVNTDDKEVNQGLRLIANYGRPGEPESRDGFNYDLPDYNVQAKILLELAKDKALDKKYDRLALALASDYGIVLSLGNDQVDKRVLDYVSKLYDYFKRTDRHLASLERPWRCSQYPLEALMLLGWGASGLRYPTFFNQVGEKPEENPCHHYWNDEFDDRQMKVWEFKWLFVSVDVLQEIRSWMSNRPTLLWSENLRPVAQMVDKYSNEHLKYYTDKPGTKLKYVTVKGKITPGVRIANPDWQWQHLQNQGNFLGNCEALLHMNRMLLKSVNIAAGSMSVQAEGLGHLLVLYYAPDSRRLLTTPNQLNIIREHAQGRINYLFQRFGWSNLHIPRINSYVKSAESTEPLQEGIPAEVVVTSR